MAGREWRKGSATVVGDGYRTPDILHVERWYAC